MQAPKLEDIQLPLDGVNANGGLEAAVGAVAPDSNGSAEQQVEEDTENDFTGAAWYEPGMPRIINVGIDGPGMGITCPQGRAWLL